MMTRGAVAMVISCIDLVMSIGSARVSGGAGHLEGKLSGEVYRYCVGVHMGIICVCIVRVSVNACVRLCIGVSVCMSQTQQPIAMYMLFYLWHT